MSYPLSASKVRLRLDENLHTITKGHSYANYANQLESL